MNPERGRKPVGFIMISISYHLFQNVNPERGRKRTFSRRLENFRLFISEREPRKGTETCLVRLQRLLLLAFQNVNPERGRKLSAGSRRIVPANLISEREPRKGTETARRREAFGGQSPRFQNVNPERGRKRRRRPQVRFSPTGQFQNVNPERGRKLSSMACLSSSVFAYFRT